jgi:hypothetical protein
MFDNFPLPPPKNVSFMGQCKKKKNWYSRIGNRLEYNLARELFMLITKATKTH